MIPPERGPTAPTPPPRRPSRVGTVLLALLAACVPGSFLGACSGGTSVEGGNPELVIGFRKEGRPVDFKGVVRIYAADSNPAFYAPSPPGDRSSQDADLPYLNIYLNHFDNCDGNSFSLRPLRPVWVMDRRCLDHAVGFRAALPLLPRHQNHRYLGHIADQPGVKGVAFNRPFNILADLDDSTTALVEGISINALRDGYEAADGSKIDVLWVDLERSVDISGIIDTAGLPDPPLIVFVPGSPLSAPVVGNSFRLAGAPRIKLPVRMVTRSGLVYGFRDSLDGTRSISFYAAGSFHFVPGNRQDSVDLPGILPFPAAPEAQPAGLMTFSDTLLVTLTAEAGVTIFYTTNGEEPGIHSNRYTEPVLITSTGILKAVAYRQGQNLSPVSANNYVQVPLPPRASPASQAFRDSVVVTLDTPAQDGVILYTLDGSAPHDSSQAYVGPLVFKSTTTLKAVTRVAGMGRSQPLVENYILIPDTLGLR